MPCLPAQADDWSATLRQYGLPGHLVGVDKQRQAFLFFEKKSPLKVKYTFPCTTGQQTGDKQHVNDLRTPEGVYFVEYKIASGLDFKEYGGIAYTLNYPNPVDRLRGKTGHGIWIHSKGVDIVPRNTKGCIAIGLDEIDMVGPSLTPGTAVVLAERLDETKVPAQDDGTAKELRRLMRQWSQAWESRSKRMFDFYDSEAWGKSMSESFTAFRQNKERLFSILRFIKIFNREIHVLEGPGYWVTWTEQLYQASNLSTEGVRRLYWQQGKDRKYRIVGMDWIPRDLGMRADFRKGRLVTDANIVVTDAEAPLPPKLDMPELAPETEYGVVVADVDTVTPGAPGAATPPAAVSPEESSQAAIPPGESPQAAHSASRAAGRAAMSYGEPILAGASNTPSADIKWEADKAVASNVASPPPLNPPVVLPPSDDVHPKDATEAAPEDAVSPFDPGVERIDPVEVPQPPIIPDDAPAGRTEVSPVDARRVRERVDRWKAYLGKQSAEIDGLYAKDMFNRVQGVAQHSPFWATQQEIEKFRRAPWVRITNGSPVRMEAEKDVVLTSWPQLVVIPDKVVQGVRKLWWKRDRVGDYRIIAADFVPGDHGLAEEYLESVFDSVASMIDAWRLAWEKADIDAYMAFYDEMANQQGRSGAATIRRQKEQLWKRVKPTMVRLVLNVLKLDSKGIVAEVDQTYKDSSGKGDRGTKTLLLQFNGRTWRILREEWAALREGGAGQDAVP